MGDIINLMPEELEDLKEWCKKTKRKILGIKKSKRCKGCIEVEVTNGRITKA